MEITDTHNCELPSEKYYRELDNNTKTTTYRNYCDSNENIVSGEHPLSKYPDLKKFCYKLVSELENLKSNESESLKKRCTHLQLWLQEKVINTVENKYIITLIFFLNQVWINIMSNINISNIEECNIKHSPIGIDYLKKWKTIYDYSLNYEHVKCAFQTEEDCSGNCKENCKEDYCRYILGIFNIYKEFEHVCSNATINQRCPGFWKDFQKNYLETSHIESKCKDVYDKLGFYKLSLFGSKISPRVDDMRKMWRNVQGVTNPATLLNPPKPPLGGNKMGLSYMPK
ncbi:PIR Superfamily Protein [Plasmodium ovale curtisi]|uniref:PIR Superfamily Protein n=1 Tax=Plasmodium ovale curtisi TaxID=864141 RepID=A0A1A8X853_PLAOA|nr:PIR Superfamily Protein [Plasmodium ovale curtisi]